MPVEVIVEDPRWDDLSIPDLSAGAVDATLAELGLDPAAFEVSLLACDDARVATLNADFRGKPQPTNVLSWPSQERGAPRAGDHPVPPDPAAPEIGDIALAFDTCAREAAEAGKSMQAHTTHLIVHGTLHLLGYDHVRDADATLMEGLESRILGKLGLDDPYRGTALGGTE